MYIMFMIGNKMWKKASQLITNDELQRYILMYTENDIFIRDKMNLKYINFIL